jgi:hypothetical protein
MGAIDSINSTYIRSGILQSDKGCNVDVSQPWHEKHLLSLGRGIDVRSAQLLCEQKYAYTSNVSMVIVWFVSVSRVPEHSMCYLYTYCAVHALLAACFLEELALKFNPLL